MCVRTHVRYEIMSCHRGTELDGLRNTTYSVTAQIYEKKCHSKSTGGTLLVLVLPLFVLLELTELELEPGAGGADAGGSRPVRCAC